MAPVEAFENVLLVLLAITAFYVFVSEMLNVSKLKEAAAQVIPKIDNLTTQTTKEVSRLDSLETAVTSLTSKIDAIQGETKTLAILVANLREPLAILMPDAETSHRNSK